jgi:hypothetical protein
VINFEAEAHVYGIQKIGSYGKENTSFVYTIIKISLLTLVKEILGVCSGNHTKYANTRRKKYRVNC